MLLLITGLNSTMFGYNVPNLCFFSCLSIKNLDKDSNVINVGDYISIGSDIKTNITVLDGYKISKVSSTAFNNITILFNN